MYNFIKNNLLLILVSHLCLGQLSDNELKLDEYPDSSIRFIHHESGVTYHSYVPYSDKKILKLLIGHVSLLVTEDEGHQCTGIIIHLRQGEYYLMKVLISTEQEYSYSRYYLKNESGDVSWDEIDLENYLMTLRRIYSEKIVDITRKPRELFLRTETTSFGNVIEHIYPLGYVIIKVLDGNEVLWEANDQVNRCMSIVTCSKNNVMKISSLTTYNDVNLSNLYFEKVNERWTPIDVILYDIKFQRIRNETSLNINIKDEYNYSFKLTHYHLQGLPAIVYAEKNNVFATRVMDGDLIIWRATRDDEKCNRVYAHFKDFQPILVKVNVCSGKSHELFYEKISDKWTSVEQSEFYEKLELYNHEENGKGDSGTKFNTETSDDDGPIYFRAKSNP